MVKKYAFWIISISIILIGMFSVRDFDSRYGRSINGDGKAYYAYLPALFIYQDPTYSFIEKMEDTYYPEDHSQFKDFRNEQRNGKFVNKTFPGLSVLYAPFFFVSIFLAWVFGYAVDGYSAPFQWGIAFSHVVYFFIGLRFLLSFFRQLKIEDRVSYLLFTVLLFGSNCWYYLVYDHSVSHIHSFFLTCVLLWTMQKFLHSKNSNYLGLAGIVLSLLVIIRPTNAVMVLFIPFLLQLRGVSMKELFTSNYIQIKPLIKPSIVCLAIISLPFLLWKWQSGLWIVYSYNEEGFNFSNPQVLNFLFSYEKGWFVWTPLIFVSLLTGIFILAKRSFSVVLWFLLPLVVIVFVLSSWWIWTFGSGFGQRTVIEYLPYLIIGTALFANKYKKIGLFYSIAVPFCFLSVFQGYQITNSILNGGETTKTTYWQHFLQWKRDAPSVPLDEKYEMVFSKKMVQKQEINKSSPFSASVQTPSLDSIQKIVIGASIGGKHGDNTIRFVLASKDGKFYKDIFISSFLYSQVRYMEFAVEISDLSAREYVFYVWNGDSGSKAKIESLYLKAFKKRN